MWSLSPEFLFHRVDDGISITWPKFIEHYGSLIIPAMFNDQKIAEISSVGFEGMRVLRRSNLKHAF